MKKLNVRASLYAFEKSMIIATVPRYTTTFLFRHIKANVKLTVTPQDGNKTDAEEESIEDKKEGNGVKTGEKNAFDELMSDGVEIKDFAPKGKTPEYMKDSVRSVSSYFPAFHSSEH